MKNKPDLKYWISVSDLMSEHEKYPSVSLTDKKGGYGLSCEIEPNGNIRLSTSSGGGHGEGNYDDKGRSAQDWMNLIVEADEVRRHYYENKQT